MLFITRDTINERAFYKHYPGSDQVVVFIHGIIEGPKQFRHLAQIAYRQGYSVYSLLLPGHGGSGEGFAARNFRDWISYVSEAVGEMKKRYEHLILVGHSMGALFCICEAAYHPWKIRRLMLLDAPLKIHLWPRAMQGAYYILKEKEILDPYILSEYKAMSVGPARHPITYVKWVRRYMELYAIICFTRKVIKHLKQPMLVIFAEKDEFVSLKSFQYFKGVNARIVFIRLKESGHFCYHYSDIIRIEKGFTRFMTKENFWL